MACGSAHSLRLGGLGRKEFPQAMLPLRRRLNISAVGVFLFMKRPTKAWAGTLLLVATGMTSGLVWLATDSSSPETKSDRVRSDRESAWNRGSERVREMSFPVGNAPCRDELLQPEDEERRDEAGKRGATGTLPAVRLANDFPLPAAAFSSFRNENPEHSSPEMRRAEEDITARFYSEIARQVAEPPNASAMERVEDAEGPTVIVRPNADNARDLQRANERFRALFGNEAYNRAAMKSTIDARLAE